MVKSQFEKSDLFIQIVYSYANKVAEDKLQNPHIGVLAYEVRDFEG